MERSEDATLDKVFIKGLMIAVFTVQSLKAAKAIDELDPDRISFVEGKCADFCHCHNHSMKILILKILYFKYL